MRVIASATHFLWTEWNTVVDAWQLGELGGLPRCPAPRSQDPAGREAARVALVDLLPRPVSHRANRIGLTESGHVRATSSEAGRQRRIHLSTSALSTRLRTSVSLSCGFWPPLAASRPNGLFFAGDLGQRIFQTPFSWRALGVDVRGRSHTLRINYRTSHQIRQQTDRLLPPELADVDGNAEQRSATVSVFNGSAPEVKTFDSAESETEAVADWLRARQGEGYVPHAIGVFVRSQEQIDRGLSAVRLAGMQPVQLDNGSGGRSGCVTVATMHLAKGLEFRAVVVVACDDEIIPLQTRIERVADDADLDEVYSTERHLLYVACTRARDRLLVTGVEPASEFLDDLLTGE